MNERFTRRAFLKTSGATTLAVALGSKGLTAASDSFESVICPTDGKENLRNSEGSIIGLRDGSLLLGYSRFRGGSSSDFAPSDIVTRRSADFGRTWTEPQIVALSKVLSVSLLRLGSGAIGMFYGRSTFKKGRGYWSGNMDDVSFVFDRQMMRVSHDEGQTWAEERNLNPPGEFSQALLNDCARRLSGGRLILPNYHGFSPYSLDPSFVQPLISDDDGATWFPSCFRIGFEVRGQAHQLSESSVAERADGSPLMISRTATGFLYKSESHDRGRPGAGRRPRTFRPPRHRRACAACRTVLTSSCYGIRSARKSGTGDSPATD